MRLSRSCSPFRCSLARLAAVAAILTFITIISTTSISITYSPVTRQKEQQLMLSRDIPFRELKIVYINRHNGTRTDLEWIFDRLNLTFSERRPDGHYGMKFEEAEKLRNTTDWLDLCKNDVVIVGDTIPDGRPVLMNLVDGLCNKTHVVLQITQRFDYDMEGEKEYYELFHKLYEMNPPNFHVVVNNPYEPFHADVIHNVKYRKFRMMRPAGVSPALFGRSNLTLSENATKFLENEHDAVNFTYAAIKAPPTELKMELMKYNVPFQALKYKYGGPANLKKYKAYVESPYQVSTMKFYENLAAGVVMMVPSKPFWKELNERRITGEVRCFNELKDFPTEQWTDLIEYYHPQFAPYVYTFYSFKELTSRLKSDQDIDTRNVRERAPLMMREVRRKTLEGWAELFAADMEFWWVWDGLQLQGKNVDLSDRTGPIMPTSPIKAEAPEMSYALAPSFEKGFFGLRLEDLENDEEFWNAILGH